MLIAEFVFNNNKNDGTGNTLFELNCGYYSKVLFEKNVNPHSKSRFTDKLVEKLKELIEVRYQNLFYIQKLLKKAYNKGVKSPSYTSGEKVWLNSKYTKIKRNQKPKTRFFRPF